MLLLTPSVFVSIENCIPPCNFKNFWGIKSLLTYRHVPSHCIPAILDNTGNSSNKSDFDDDKESSSSLAAALKDVLQIRSAWLVRVRVRILLLFLFIIANPYVFCERNNCTVTSRNRSQGKTNDTEQIIIVSAIAGSELQYRRGVRGKRWGWWLKIKQRFSLSIVNNNALALWQFCFLFLFERFWWLNSRKLRNLEK